MQYINKAFNLLLTDFFKISGRMILKYFLKLSPPIASAKEGSRSPACSTNI